VRLELKSNKKIEYLKIITECVLCQVRAEADDTVNDINITFEHDRLCFAC